MIRCKIIPKFTEGGVHLTIEWVDIADGEIIVSVVAKEEFAIDANREGCAYVTRGGFESGNMQSGTFWIDEQGRRHFVMQAEAGHVGLFGEKTKVTKEGV